MSCVFLKAKCPECSEEMNFSANLARGADLSGEMQKALEAVAVAAHMKMAHAAAKPEPVADTECIHGMEYGCSICSGKDFHKPEAEGVKFSYQAKYNGQCPECDLPIVIGQQCVKTTKDRNLHADCLP